MKEPNHVNFMKAAIKIAKLSIARGQTPFGACIVKNNKIISCVHNEVWKKNDITAHAEIQTIRKACKKLNSIDLTGCIIYSTCEPCPMCFSACHWARISKIVYGAKIKDAKECGFNELDISNKHLREKGKSKITIIDGVLKKECIDLFLSWKKNNNKKVY